MVCAAGGANPPRAPRGAASLTRDWNDLAREGRLPADPREVAVPIGPPPDAEEPRPGAHLPPFPLGVFPEWFARAVEAFAATTRSPPEMGALPGMATMAYALANRCVRCPSWRPVSPLLWLGLVAPSGSGKSPTAMWALDPVEARDQRLADEHDLALSDWRSEQRNRKRRDPERPEPRRRRASVTDTTPEALQRELQAVDGSPLLVVSDELIQLLGSMDGYRSGGAKQGRGTWLKLWNGAPIHLVRASGACVDVAKPKAIVLGGVQPSELGKLELRDGDGLAARYLWAHSRPQASGLGRDLPTDVVEEWARAFAVGCESEGCVQPFDGSAVRVIDGALREWKGRAIELEDDGSGLLAALYGKAGEQAMRLIALLHGLDSVGWALEGHPMIARPVSGGVVERAARLMGYFLAQGSHTVRLVTRPPDPTREHRLQQEEGSLADALRRALPPTGEIEEPAGAWALRLRQAGHAVAPTALGRAWRRLEAAPVPGLRVWSGKRGSGRVLGAARA